MTIFMAWYRPSFYFNSLHHHQRFVGWPFGTHSLTSLGMLDVHVYALCMHCIQLAYFSLHARGYGLQFADLRIAQF
jgi:hypothetical protein